MVYVNLHTHVCGIYENDTDEPISRAGTETRGEGNRLVDVAGEGEGGRGMGVRGREPRAQVVSVHGILQARVLEWLDISSSRGSSRLRD